ncbi:hypothetical protein D9613_006590 [Agrocybe pediades]|uniref:Uncharacterized protein n=1 Tax=Agrocybe pediades TaxID=84607 RepID=A0A8H4QHM0_9AGAR|nr:hypothetical protein D9613_006590 [Agrocybe pediades]
MVEPFEDEATPNFGSLIEQKWAWLQLNGELDSGFAILHHTQHIPPRIIGWTSVNVAVEMQ